MRTLTSLGLVLLFALTAPALRADLLADALDQPNHTFTSTSTPPWTGRVAVSHDGVDAAKAGSATEYALSTFETTVQGPGTFTFWWKLDGQGNRVYTFEAQKLSFSIDGDWALRYVENGSEAYPAGLQLWDAAVAAQPIYLGNIGDQPIRFADSGYNYAYLGEASGRFSLVMLNTSDIETDADGDGLPDAWEISYRGTLAYGAADPAGRHDLPMLVAYAVGAHADNAGQDLVRLGTSEDGQHLTLSFDRAPEQRKYHRVRLRVQASNDGSTWTEIWNSDALNDASGPVTVTDTATNGGGPRLLRLTAESVLIVEAF